MRMHTSKQLEKDLRGIGIRPGDVILMHSSYKALGGIEGGAKTFFEVMLHVLGQEGTLVVPALSFEAVTRENPEFDLQKTPGCVGYLAEFFRTGVPGVVRSMHATHSCCAIGKYAREITQGHELDITPVGTNSPFAKLPRYHGKIFMLGCGTGCNTSMHGVEEDAEPPYCIDWEHPINYILKDGETSVCVKSFRHNFMTEDGKHIRQRYDRMVNLLEQDEISHGYVLAAESYLMDASAVWKKGKQKLMADPLYFVDYPVG